MSERPSAVQLLEQGTGLLSRSHLRELGLERRAVDAVFRALPVVALPGYSRPLVRVEDYVRLLAGAPSAATGCERDLAPVGVAA